MEIKSSDIVAMFLIGLVMVGASIWQFYIFKNDFGSTKILKKFRELLLKYYKFHSDLNPENYYEIKESRYTSSIGLNNNNSNPLNRFFAPGLDYIEKKRIEDMSKYSMLGAHFFKQEKYQNRIKIGEIKYVLPEKITQIQLYSIPKRVEYVLIFSLAFFMGSVVFILFKYTDSNSPSIHYSCLFLVKILILLFFISVKSFFSSVYVGVLLSSFIFNALANNYVGVIPIAQIFIEYLFGKVGDSVIWVYIGITFLYTITTSILGTIPEKFDLKEFIKSLY